MTWALTGFVIGLAVGVVWQRRMGWKEFRLALRKRVVRRAHQRRFRRLIKEVRGLGYVPLHDHDFNGPRTSPPDFRPHPH